ncbi:MAG: TIGR01777 family oxidoreductase [Candidatus Synoicihabitans palmerolidicus]|nr:TIGR01777 family oxidoreductase [Candidatus Synoicihabitans palmerolidicus]
MSRTDDGPPPPPRRSEIRSSCVDGTRTLINAIHKLDTRPRVFLGGSAVGIYGDQGAAELDETSSPGTGFLADVCREWERESAAAQAMGIRTVLLRTGIVLHPRGGALAKLQPLFACGLGGSLGEGKHWQSWIGMDDWLRACRHAIECEELRGPLNLVAPEVVPQREFEQTLGRVMGRPTVLPTPKAAIQLLFGQMADEVLLASTRATPSVLPKTGYEFLHPSLENALRHVLGK